MVQSSPERLAILSIGPPLILNKSRGSKEKLITFQPPSYLVRLYKNLEDISVVVSALAGLAIEVSYVRLLRCLYGPLSIICACCSSGPGLCSPAIIAPGCSPCSYNTTGARLSRAAILITGPSASPSWGHLSIAGAPSLLGAAGAPGTVVLSIILPVRAPAISLSTSS